MEPKRRTVPLLLYDDGCATCSRIAGWVHRAARRGGSAPSIVERPVGNDPAELHRLNAGLGIWDAYAESHVIMPDGSMKLGGEAVAEVFRSLSSTKWMAPILDVRVFGLRPFQKLLNLAYVVLDDVRPLFGCESCGMSKPWVRPIERLIGWVKTKSPSNTKATEQLHFKPLSKKR